MIWVPASVELTDLRWLNPAHLIPERCPGAPDRFSQILTINESDYNLNPAQRYSVSLERVLED